MTSLSSNRDILSNATLAGSLGKAMAGCRTLKGFASVEGKVPTVDVKYFALFRERAGRDEERMTTPAATVGALYEELSPRLGLAPTMVRAAVNGEFVDDGHALRDGDEVVFVPPVAGG